MAPYLCHCMLAALLSTLSLSLQGCGDKTPSPSPTPAPACKPMTDTDPCWQKCHPGMESGTKCTTEICQALGKIGCNDAQCELMGDSGSETAHCMSPMAPAPTPAPSMKGFGGLMTDPNHYKGQNLAGTRIISDTNGQKSGSVIWVAGSDDGSTFWAVPGKWEDKSASKLMVDFSSKGGPADFKGDVSSEGIKWQDGNQWSFVDTFPFTLAPQMSGWKDMSGFYFDDDSYAKGSLGGGRMLVDNGPDPSLNVVVVGMDKNMHYFFEQGSVVDKDQGTILLNTIAGTMKGTFSAGQIKFQDGETWTQQEVSTSAAPALQV